MKKNDFKKFNESYLKLKKVLPLRVAYILATIVSTTVI